ncbi:MAG: hypothetical protein APU95_01720 [Hadesarchaea archaeon YNP_N21]|jgi:radical SAM superfamily enzyme YgiQ (UPF0313 family)|nr:MAG: hypothetical protein APU95_01720 [Hadesarchaea archaeon YNP_N21]
MQGYKIVLTADRTLMSEYGGHIFLGFSACVPRGLVPDGLYFSIFCPSVEANSDGSAKYAPCGTRRIEAALLDYGFRREDVIVAHPDHLDKVIGPCTKVLGVTENDPLGIGPATSTFTQIFGGQAYMALKFRELLDHPSVKRFRPKIIVGGPGAWQLENEGVRRNLGVDCVVIGEGEKVVGPLFEKAVKGEDLPGVVHGDLVRVDEIPEIKGPTITGVVEIARGCGRGCRFCAPTLLRYRCFPLEHILKEIDINLRAGKQPCLHAEDVLRYKAKGFEVNEEATVGLFREVKSHPGVNKVGISHFSLASVLSAPKVVEEISRILDEDGKAQIGGITGIETGSPRLIENHMPGKCKPFKPEDWPQIVLNSFEILSENNWVPCATLILGLPGEEEKDVDFTIDLVNKLGEFKSLIVPLFFVSVGGLKDSDSFTFEKMTHKHSELFLECWEHNFRWAPRLLDEHLDASVKNRFVRAGVKLVFSYAIREGRELILKCRREYDGDMRAMIEDARRGELTIGKVPGRIMRLAKMVV